MTVKQIGKYLKKKEKEKYIHKHTYIKALTLF